MEIKRKMNMPADALYKSIIDSVLYDIQKQTGTRRTRQQLKNFSYEKTFSKNSRAKIKVEEIVENSAYHYRTSTVNNDFLVKYDIETLDDFHCELTYTEEMKSNGFLQNMNDFLTGLVLGPFKRRHFKKMLKMMEDDYLEKQQKNLAK